MKKLVSKQDLIDQLLKEGEDYTKDIDEHIKYDLDDILNKKA